MDETDYLISMFTSKGTFKVGPDQLESIGLLATASDDAYIKVMDDKLVLFVILMLSVLRY